MLQRLDTDVLVETSSILREANESMLDAQVPLYPEVELIHIVCTILGTILYTDYVKWPTVFLPGKVGHFRRNLLAVYGHWLLESSCTTVICLVLLK